MFVDYTSDFDRTLSVLRDFCKSSYFAKWNKETSQLEVTRYYDEVATDSYHLIRTSDENDPEHLQGYFAIDEKNKKIIIRVTDDYFLRLTFDLEDQDRVDYPDQYKEDWQTEKVERVGLAHAVINRKLAHYEIRGYNGDEDSIANYPCRYVEQKLYEVRESVGRIYFEKKGQTFTFAELPWKHQVSYIIRDLQTSIKCMKLKDWCRKSNPDDYRRDCAKRLEKGNV